VRPKREMVRVVRTPTDGVQIDHTGKTSGRGAYLCPVRGCWEKALAEKRLGYALKTEITSAEREVLEAYAQTLPVSAEADGEDCE
jgi:predicted RNA-binding protein YlxR (DUF448 family)